MLKVQWEIQQSFAANLLQNPTVRIFKISKHFPKLCIRQVACFFDLQCTVVRYIITLCAIDITNVGISRHILCCFSLEVTRRYAHLFVTFT